MGLRYSNLFIFLDRLRQAAVTRSVSPIFELRAISKIRASQYFDSNWYLRKNPDVAKSHVDPVLHYFATGWREERDPGPMFSTGGYLAHNPDIAAAGMNPLAHFLLCGLSEGRPGGVLAPNVKRGPIDPRIIAAAGRYRADSRPVILMLLHQSGGGTEQHVLSLAAKLAPRARILMLKVGPNFRFILSTLDSKHPDEFDLHDYDVAALCEVLQFFNVQRVHVHHVYGFFEQAPALLAELGVPYDLTVHDYMLLCPRIFMFREQTKGYCQEPDEFGCTRCLLQDPPAMSIDIVAWRWRGRALIEGAERVICPTPDCATRILRYAPRANVLVVPHEDPRKFEHRDVRVPALAQNEPMRIVVLGVMTGHKGLGFLVDCVSYWKKIGLPVKVTVIGESLPPEPAKHLHFTGSYNNGDLPLLIANVDPHLILYPQKCPETYSFTLSEGLMAKVPLLAPDLGSFRDRMEGKEWCWLYDPNASLEDFTTLISQIRVEHIVTKKPPPVIAPPSRGSDDAFFYQHQYLTGEIRNPAAA